MNYFKRALFVLEEKNSLIGGFLIKFLRSLRFLLYKFIFFFDKNKIKTNNIFKVYWVNPKHIQYCYSGQCSVFTDRGSVKNGNWDIPSKKFIDTDVYRGMKERFVYKKEWEKTQFYNDVLKRINRDEVVWRCINKKQWKLRLKKIDALYQSIKENGYYLQTEQRNEKLNTYSGKDDEYYQKIDEVLISIGRNGQLLASDGAHRLAIAKILNLSEIPVMVLVRHNQWMSFKKELMSYARLQNNKLYQPAYHCDLEDISFAHGPERFELIKNNLSSTKGFLLDIGANIGYFCHKFEEVGFNCLAVEVDPQDVYFMEKLKKANYNKFQVIKGSIFNYRKKQTLSFDVVLALNIFHHFLKRKINHKRFKNLLNRIEAREMFFETHNPEELQMKNAYKNYKSEDFVKFIINNSSFEKYSLIFSFNNGRRLYKIFK